MAASSAAAPRRWLRLILLWLLLIAVSHPGMVAHFNTRLPSAHMDTVYHLAGIDWQNHFLFREPGLVFNIGTFYPHARATYFGPPVFAIAPWFALFQLLGLSVYGQFNLFLVLTFLLGAAGIFRLAREALGQEEIPAFIAGAIFVVFSAQRSLFIWLPLFMSAFVPWTLLYFFRYLKQRRRGDLLLFLACGLAQFLISAYLGVYLLALFIPWLVLFALLFGVLPPRQLLKLAAGMAVLAALALAVYLPVISSFHSVTTYRSYRPAMLLNVGDIFTANQSFLYGQLLGMQRPALYNWFPGMAVALLFFLSWLPAERGRRWPWVAFTGSALVAILLLKDARPIWATLLLFTLMVILVVGHVRRRRRNMPLALLALGFAAYLLFFFDLTAIGLPRQAIPYSLLAAAVPYFQRMCEYKRVFIILVPVMAVLATQALGLWSGRRRWLPLLALGLIWLENFQPAIGDWGQSLPLGRRAPIYAAIPRQGDKVILELPFFGGKEIWSLPSFFQSIYGYSLRYHWNFIVNGRDSFAPLDHAELGRRATIPEVLTPESIEWLKRRYAVDYIVINWPLLTPAEARLVRARMPVLAAAGEKVLRLRRQATVFRLVERGEVSELVRTYSAYHLRHRRLRVRFRAPCSLEASVAVGGRPWRRFRLQGEAELRFRVDRERIGPDCETIAITFSRPAGVAEIALVR